MLQQRLHQETLVRILADIDYGLDFLAPNETLEDVLYLKLSKTNANNGTYAMHGFLEVQGGLGQPRTSCNSDTRSRIAAEIC